MPPPALISVVIPTCCRNDLLANCLDRLAPSQQTGMELANDQDSTAPLLRYEVIVTDDSSATTAQGMIKLQYPWARWVAGPRRGPAANRNNGASHARGEWIAFLDDDCLPDRQWLNALSHAIAATPLDVAEGRTLCPDKRDDPQEEHVENPSGGVYWSCNLAVRRETFQALNGFDETFLEAGGEDMEFAWRIEQAALRTQFVPEFLVIHPARRITWRKLLHRVLMTRWILLYHLRTQQGLPLDTGAVRVTWNLILGRTLDLLRTTSHLFTKFDAGSWRRQLFYQVLKWVSFPFLIPYLLVWEFRFRRQLIDSSPTQIATKP